MEHFDVTVTNYFHNFLNGSEHGKQEWQKDWPNLLHQHAMVYNTSVQKSIGYEPFFLMHGFHTATTVEVVLPTPAAIKGDPVADSRETAD